MAWTEDDVIVLEKAIATGATSVQYADKKVDYRSLSDMYRILADMKNELGLDSNIDNGRRYGSYDKGLK
jgi:hypothetical protein